MTAKQQITFIKSCFLLDESDRVIAMQSYADDIEVFPCMYDVCNSYLSFLLSLSWGTSFIFYIGGKVSKDEKSRTAKPRASEFLRLILLVRQPEALSDLTEASGVFDTRELLDKEHIYKRFNPQVLFLFLQYIRE